MTQNNFNVCVLKSAKANSVKQFLPSQLIDTQCFSKLWGQAHTSEFNGGAEELLRDANLKLQKYLQFMGKFVDTKNITLATDPGCSVLAITFEEHKLNIIT